MASYGNFSFPNRTGQAVNDLHLSFPTGTANVNLLGVDGVGPDAPNAGYNLEGDGSGEITISGYNVPIGGQVVVRIKTPGMRLPTPITAQWTQDGKPVKATFQVASLPPPPPVSEPVIVDEGAGQAIARLRQAVDEVASVLRLA